MAIKSHTVNAKSHADIELHVIVELQLDNVELLEREAHSDLEVE